MSSVLLMDLCVVSNDWNLSLLKAGLSSPMPCRAPKLPLDLGATAWNAVCVAERWKEVKLLTSHQHSPSLINSSSPDTKVFSLFDSWCHCFLAVSSGGKRDFQILSAILFRQICSTWKWGRKQSCFEQFSVCYLHNAILLHYLCPFLQGWAGPSCSGIWAILTIW